MRSAVAVVGRIVAGRGSKAGTVLRSALYLFAGLLPVGQLAALLITENRCLVPGLSAPARPVFLSL